MIIEQAPSHSQEPLSDAEQVDQHLDQLLKNKRVNYRSYVDRGIIRRSWLQWHRLHRNWFEHHSVVDGTTDKRTNSQNILRTLDFTIGYKPIFTTIFLLDPDTDLVELRDKSPNALVKLARKDPPEVLAKRFKERQF